MSSDDKQLLSEDEIAALIASEERFVRPSPDQVARIRASLCLREAPPIEDRGGKHSAVAIVDSAKNDLQLIQTATDGQADSANGIGRGRLGWLAVAASIVVALLFLTLRGADDTTIDTAAPTDATVDLSACPADVAELGRAIETWGGIANWSITASNHRYWQAGEPVEPDLFGLALGALGQLPDQDADDVRRTTRDLETLSKRASLPVADELATTMRAAIDVLDLRIPPGGCRIDLLAES